MARVHHRPPPPVPTSDHEEIEDNYGVWSDSEFDDPLEVYENYEKEEENEDGSDYEQPEEPEKAPVKSVHKTPVSQVQPHVPPRPGGQRYTPAPPFLPLPAVRSGGVSPKVSPMNKKKVTQKPPEPPEDDEETYEAVDLPESTQEDEGEVYNEVDDDDEPKIPLSGMRTLPPVPKPGGGRPLPKQPVPTRANPAKVSPLLSKRELPMPPPMIPSPTKSPNLRKAQHQSELPPPPAEVLAESDDDMYEAGEFYEKKEATVQQKNAKPLPKPPSECDDECDEFYTEVPETIINPWKISADRPVPSVPVLNKPPSKPTTSVPAPGGSTRFPIHKLQEGLAKLAEAKANATNIHVISETNDSKSNLFGGDPLLNAKIRLKPVNRGESLNTPAKPNVLVTVKRAESENIVNRRDPLVKSGGEKKTSMLSEIKDKLERQKVTETQNIGHMKAESPENTPSPASFGRKIANTPKPPPEEVPGKRRSVPKVEPSGRLQPPNIPPPRRSSPSRNPKKEKSTDCDSR